MILDIYMLMPHRFISKYLTSALGGGDLKIQGCKTASEISSKLPPIVRPVSANGNTPYFVAQAPNLRVTPEFTPNFKIYI